MDRDLTIIVYLSIWILLPILPAYLLFKVSPLVRKSPAALPAAAADPVVDPGASTGAVSGMFQGMQIKLAGAFSGYFLVFLMLSGTIREIINESDLEIWEIQGNVIDASTHMPIDRKLNPFISAYPKNLVNNGKFKFQLVGKRNGACVEFPDLSAEADSYMPVSLKEIFGANDEKNKDDWDISNMKARLKDTLRLIPVPASEGTAVYIPQTLNAVTQ